MDQIKTLAPARKQRARVPQAQFVNSTTRLNRYKTPVQEGTLNPTKVVDLSIYYWWNQADYSKVYRELFAVVYPVMPQKGHSPSKRKRDLYRLFKKSIGIIFYNLECEKAQALSA